MALQFLGEVRLFPYNFAPRQWAYCAGQILSIQQNTALFSLLGTMYGGNGVTTFALPDLRGRAIVGTGTSPYGGGSYVQGQASGSETVTLITTQMPMHNHMWTATSVAASQATPTAGIFSAGRKPSGTSQLPAAIYGAYTNPVPLAATTLGTAGGNQPHNNMQPYLVLAYCIALQGVFPSRN